MLDLDAPIVPGVGAAGVALGQPIEAILVNLVPQRIVDLVGCERYDFGAVILWVANGRVNQIGVGPGYRGALACGIGVGSSLAEVERLVGPIAEDEEDNLMVLSLPGWCFEVPSHDVGPEFTWNGTEIISEIFVFTMAAPN